ncbi:MAG: helix-turn-helix domain-containing protein [Cyanobacteria bacterium J06650_10]
MTKKKSNHEFSDYHDLLAVFPPRLIASDDVLEEVTQVIDSFFKKSQLTEDEHSYLEVLTWLVREYNNASKRGEIPDIYGIDLLKELLKEKKLRQKDLVDTIPIFKTESIVSAVLSGRRKLSLDNIEKLSQAFNISPAAFFPRHT